MKYAVKSISAGLFCVCATFVALAQQPSKTTASVPRLVTFSGTLNGISGQQLSGTVGVTFALYEEESGGIPLWMETQNVQADGNGRYTATLGATRNDGIPSELFVSGQGRWLGVQAQGEPERPRVLMASVPYALKAVDAETLGGLPPSAFLLAGAAAGSAASPLTSASEKAVSPADTLAAASVTGAGTKGYIPQWTSASAIGKSVLFQSGTGSAAKMGINTITPAATLDINGGGNIRGTLSLPPTGTATATAGNNSQPLDLVASAFNSSVSTAIAQTFQLQAEPVGNDTAATSGVLSLLFGSRTSTPSETGLKIASNGQITFATGQTFPGTGTGTGTVTSVGSGAGLTGGPITSSGTLGIATGGVSNIMLANPSLTVLAGTDLTGGGSVTLGGSTTLNLDITKVPQLNSANTFTGNQTVNGAVTGTQLVSSVATGAAPLVVNSTTQVSNLNASLLGGYSATSFQPAGAYATLGVNTFTGNQSVTGNVAASGTVSGSSFGIGSSLFAFGSYSLQDAFLGFSGNANTTGADNTANGFQALYSNTSGYYNTASGYQALFNNTAGNGNTASGYQAQLNNTLGGYNTAEGWHALLNNTTGGSNTAIGSFAMEASTTGNNNIAIGNIAGYYVTTASNNIEIGSQGTASDDGTIRIGTPFVGGCTTCQTSAFVAGIYGVNTSGIPVYINSNGQLGTISSSRRYKENIQDMGDASDGLLQLRPVLFQYKKAFDDGSKPIQYGLVAEEVAEVYPDLVARSADGQIETVKYQLLDPMLLNELQKQHTTITAQEEQIRSLEERLARVEAALSGTTVTAAAR